MTAATSSAFVHPPSARLSHAHSQTQEVVQGKSLAQMVSAGKRASEEEVLRIATDLLSVLKYLSGVWCLCARVMKTHTSTLLHSQHMSVCNTPTNTCVAQPQQVLACRPQGHNKQTCAHTHALTVLGLLLSHFCAFRLAAACDPPRHQARERGG